MKLNEQIIDYSLLNSFDIEQLKKDLVLPFSKDAFYTHVALCKQSNESSLTQTLFQPLQSCKNEILFFLSNIKTRTKLYELASKSIHNENLNQQYVSEFLDSLIAFAFEKRSSDIHFETAEKSFIVRFRIDGRLKIFFVFPKALYPIISSVIKLKATLDITQKRKPLNGRFSMQLSDKNVDFRFSSMPTIYGESIVIRILDEFAGYQNLNTLGFSQTQLTRLKRNIAASSGMILITGPTGSGKTTTLYSILQQLNAEDKKIITIEDPIEYQLHNIQQVAVNNAIGLTFNEILKHILRQDPDIIMIGEIRDKESLQIAFQASLTGHLVLSTLHTNDAVSTINRLYDLEAKSYIMASTLKTIISQRLVLKCCTCEQGCTKCNFSCFDGRVSISEVFEIDETMASMINKKQSLSDILHYAKEQGFKTIEEDGLSKVEQGITSQKELYKVIGNSNEKI